MKRRKERRVLSEAEYTAGIDEIVQREYFPAVSPARRGEQEQRGQQLSLDEFQQRYTSEDNARFRQLADRDRQRRDERYRRVFGTGRDRSHSRSGYLLEPRLVAVGAAARGSRVIEYQNTRLLEQSPGLSVDGGNYEESVTGTPPAIGGYRLLREPFRMAAPSPREAIAMRLGKRPTPLSLATHRLLRQQGSDLGLWRAYSSPH